MGMESHYLEIHGSTKSLVHDLGLDILIDQTERGMVTIAARKRKTT